MAGRFKDANSYWTNFCKKNILWYFARVNASGCIFFMFFEIIGRRDVMPFVEN